MTLGIVPTRPETGYGYIQAEEQRNAGPYQVKRFVEKPDLDQGHGIPRDRQFLLEQRDVHVAGRHHSRQVHGVHARTLRRLVLARLTFSADVWELEDLKPQIDGMYPDINGESIDFGIMEKADDVVLIPADFGWSDVGSWSALPEVMNPDEAGNVAINVRESLSFDSGGCLVYGGGKLTAFIGVKDLIVVDTSDALLVCNRDRAQDVKRVVEELTKRGLAEYL